MERSADVDILDVLDVHHLFCCNTMQDCLSCVGCQMLNCRLTQREDLPLGHTGQKSSPGRGIGMGSFETPEIPTLPIGPGLMTHAGCGISAVVDTCELHILSHFPLLRRRCQQDSIFMICLTVDHWGRGHGSWDFVSTQPVSTNRVDVLDILNIPDMHHIFRCNDLHSLCHSVP